MSFFDDIAGAISDVGGAVGDVFGSATSVIGDVANFGAGTLGGLFNGPLGSLASLGAGFIPGVGPLISGGMGLFGKLLGGGSRSPAPRPGYSPAGLPMRGLLSSQRFPRTPPPLPQLVRVTIGGKPRMVTTAQLTALKVARKAAADRAYQEQVRKEREAQTAATYGLLEARDELRLAQQTAIKQNTVAVGAPPPVGVLPPFPQVPQPGGPLYSPPPPPSDDRRARWEF